VRCCSSHGARSSVVFCVDARDVGMRAARNMAMRNSDKMRRRRAQRAARERVAADALGARGVRSARCAIFRHTRPSFFIFRPRPIFIFRRYRFSFSRLMPRVRRGKIFHAIDISIFTLRIISFSRAFARLPLPFSMYAELSCPLSRQRYAAERFRQIWLR